MFLFRFTNYSQHKNLTLFLFLYIIIFPFLYILILTFTPTLKLTFLSKKLLTFTKQSFRLVLYIKIRIIEQNFKWCCSLTLYELFLVDKNIISQTFLNIYTKITICFISDYFPNNFRFTTCLISDYFLN